MLEEELPIRYKAVLDAVRQCLDKSHCIYILVDNGEPYLAVAHGAKTRVQVRIRQNTVVLYGRWLDQYHPQRFDTRVVVLADPQFLDNLYDALCDIEWVI